MAYEKRWQPVSAVAITAPGTADGKLSVSSTLGFKVKMQVRIDTSPEPLLLEVKRVTSPTQLELGELNTPIEKRADLSSVTVLNILLAYEQKRSNIPLQEISRWVYEEEPTVAWRNILVDPLGRFYSTSNPFPVRLSDGSVNIGTVNAELEVQLSHQDNVPDAGDVADSVRIGDGVEEMAVNPDGSINVYPQNSIINQPFDDIQMTYDPVTQDMTNVKYKLSGTIVREWNLSYDAFGNVTEISKV